MEEAPGDGHLVQILQHALSLPFEEFARQMLQNEQLQEILRYYVRNARRWWEKEREKALPAEDEMFASVFLCFHRLILDDAGLESVQASHPGISEILHDRCPKVVDGYVLVDICSLYGRVFQPEVKRLLECIAIHWHEALRHDLETIFGFHALQTSQDINIRSLLDLANATQTIVDMLGYARAASFFQVENLAGSQIWKLYEPLVTPLLRMVEQHAASKEILWQSRFIRSGLLVFLHTFFVIKFWSPLDLLLDEDGQRHDPLHAGREESVVEALLGTLLALVHDEDDDKVTGVFLGDYNALFHVNRRLERLLETPAFSDFADRIHYVMEVVKLLEHTNVDGAGPGGVRALSNADVAQREDPSQGASSGAPSPEVSRVKEVLPHLGTYFVSQLLLHLNNDPERAIQRVLENKVPSAIAHLDHTQEAPRVVKVEKSNPSTAEFFDEFHGSKDRSLQEIKARTLLAAAGYDEYEDEYDDAYDDTGFNAGDRTIDGLDRGSVVPQVENGLSATTKSSASTSWRPGMVDVDGVRRDRDGKIIEEDENDLMRPNPNHRSPLKADASKESAPGQSRKADRKASGSPAASSDLSDRQKKKKQVNKAKIGNHSRKRGAAKKQARSMFG